MLSHPSIKNDLMRGRLDELKEDIASDDLGREGGSGGRRGGTSKIHVFFLR